MSSLFTRSTVPALFDNIIYKEWLMENWQKDSKNLVYPMLFNVESSERKQEDIAGWATVGLAAEKFEGSEIPSDNFTAMPTVRLTHKTFGKAITLTREAVMDDPWGQIKNSQKIAGAISDSFRTTRETYAANVFNLGFTSGHTQGTDFMGGHGSGDGQILFYSAHPYNNNTTGSNTMTGQLSETTLEQAMILLAATKDPSGNYLVGQSLLSGEMYLLHQQTNMILAKKLTQSAQEPQSANNAINAFKGEFKPLTWNFLSSTTNWFIVCAPKNNHLKFYDRELFETREWPLQNGDMQHQAFSRFSLGWAYWSGLIGVQGA